jgi:predicted NAD/FAD-dependent oxidoreductase
LTAAPARIAVIGAGIAGLACARSLHEAAVAVSIFEQDDVPGGRAATLIDEAGPYDHGAQYFTAESERFATAVRRWEAEGIVQHWRGRIVAFNVGEIDEKTDSAERFVPVPGMRRLGLHLAQGLDVHYATPISGLMKTAEGWTLRCASSSDADAVFGPFDAVCVTTPSQAAAALMEPHTPLAALARTVQWDPCWALVIALASRSGAEFDGAFINDDPILGWAALDSGKPRRGRVDGVAERWVLHARPRWSRRYFDMEEAQVVRWLARSFSARLRRTLNPLKAQALFWPFATPLNPLPRPFLWDANVCLGMAGDWCGGPRVEGAYLSGLALAEAAVA